MINLTLFSKWFPFDPLRGQKLQTCAKGVTTDASFVAHVSIPASKVKAADEDGVHAPINCKTAVVTVENSITSPLIPRCITATAGGTAGDIKAVRVKIFGTDCNGKSIVEDLPAFTADTAGTVIGSKAFKTVTKIVVPAMDGAGCTVAVGFGNKIGIPYLLELDTVVCAFLDKVREATNPTVTKDGTNISGNTFTLNSSLVDNKQVDIFLLV